AEAIAAYEAMGLEATSVEQVPSEAVNVALFPIGDTRIELLEPSEPGSVLDRFLQKHGEGVHHVALEVEDVEEASEALRRAGLRLVYESPHAGEGGSRINFVHPSSTRGVLLELREGP
ncbi:MAG: VOC family protein, partial [Thermoplasmata archaeon]|nr:VOC family protein [Thermoplasmata archaeon]